MDNEKFIYARYVDTDEPVLLLNTHVGMDPDDGMGVDANVFIDELLQLDGMGKTRIQVWINSPGGIVTDGMAIYSAILKTKTKVDTYVTGLAASIAAVIFQAGRKRIMADYGVLMYHNAFNIDGDEDKSLELINSCLATMIERSDMSRGEIVAMMNAETFLTADEAKENGLCDIIEQSTDFNKKRLTGADTFNKAQAVFSVMNKKRPMVAKEPVIWNMAVQMHALANKGKMLQPSELNTESTPRTFESAMKKIANKQKQ